LEAAVQVLRYLFEPSESFNITHDNFLPLLEVPSAENLAFYLEVVVVLVDNTRKLPFQLVMMDLLCFINSMPWEKEQH
jgi:hypothetical protein